ncbi:MAG: SPOR domain-containing protein [Ignavibacteriaceae bacterium]|nr:SPOR domain-containing protein [Ignavibacteriaceae bacterium]
MKSYKILVTLVLISFCIFISCSSSEKTQVKKQETDSLYIFDEIPPEDIFKLESPVQQSVDVYVVQIGAFSNLDRAKQFAEESRAKLNKDIKVEFNEKKNLYVVWIHPPFQDRTAAETFRNGLWNYKEFRDAWIITLESKK